MAKIRHDRPEEDQPITEAWEYQQPYGSEPPMTTPESIMDPAEPYRRDAVLSTGRERSVRQSAAEGGDSFNRRLYGPRYDEMVASGAIPGPDISGDTSVLEAGRVADEAMAEYRDATAPPAPERTAPLFSGPRDTGPSRTSSFTTSGTRFSNPESEAEYRELHQMAAALREEAAGRRGHMATEVENRAVTMSQQRAAMNLLAESGEEEARSRMSEIAKAYDEAEVDMASLRVDPRRWEQDTPALAQVLMGIGSAAFAFFTGGQGVNPIVALIDRAIERDTDAQMANMKAKLGAHQVGMEKQELLNKLEGNIRASMWQRSLNAYEGMVVEGQMQMQAQDQMDASTAMMDKATEARIASLQPYIQQYSATTQTAAGGGSSLPPLTPDFVQKQVQNLGAMAEGSRIVTEIADMINQGVKISPVSSSPLINKLATLVFDDPELARAGDVKSKVESFATRLARATGVDVGNFAQQEALRFIRAIEGRRWDVAQTAMRAIYDKLDDFRVQQRATLQGLARTHNTAALAEVDQLMEDQYQRARSSVFGESAKQKR